MKIIAGTGHRPDKLGGYSKAVEAKTYQLAYNALAGNEVIVISGLALGWDTELAEAALDLGLELWGYAPCLKQDAIWPLNSRRRYQHIVNRCSKIKYGTEQLYPGPWCMHRRDMMMVDDCDLVLALWNGSGGGTTWKTMEYAEEKNKPVLNLWKHFVCLPSSI